MLVLPQTEAGFLIQLQVIGSLPSVFPSLPHGIHSISCLSYLCPAFWTPCSLMSSLASPNGEKAGLEKNGNSDKLYFLGLQSHPRW